MRVPDFQDTVQVLPLKALPLRASSNCVPNSRRSSNTKTNMTATAVVFLRVCRQARGSAREGEEGAVAQSGSLLRGPSAGSLLVPSVS